MQSECYIIKNYNSVAYCVLIYSIIFGFEIWLIVSCSNFFIFFGECFFFFEKGTVNFNKY